MMRSEWDNDEIVERFRDWLNHTAREIHDLGEAGHASDEADGAAAEWPATGLLQVVEALTAMRHELKLQTRSGRSLEESLQAARQSLDAAMRQFQSVQAKEAESARRAAQPLVEALAGLDESLWRGTRALEISHRQLTEKAPQRLRQILDDEYRRLSWWRQWSIRVWHSQLRDQIAAATASVAEEEFSQIMEGYRLIQDRVRQELRKQGLSRVETVGRRVDPTCMTVVDVVDDPNLPPETVVDELRPGYLWRETVIRCAEVRAVKSRGGTRANSEEPADRRGDPMERESQSEAWDADNRGEWPDDDRQ